jgi:hypothetical protein
MRVGQLRREIKADTQSDRTGIFTSGIVREGLEHPIRLVFTGRQHAGENLADVLAQRQSGLPAPFHMCDGLSRNDPKGHPVVPCNCVVHARRNFVEIHGAFPDQCQKVVTSFAGIYRIEAQAKHLSPDQRQRLHQQHSQPVLDELKQWFAEQTDTRQIEPNSGFGQAMNYLLKRWLCNHKCHFLSLRVAPSPGITACIRPSTKPSYDQRLATLAQPRNPGTSTPTKSQVERSAAAFRGACRPRHPGPSP